MSELSSFDSKEIDGLDFCAKVYALLEDIRRRPDGVSSLRLKSTRVEKKLLEELLPICKYIQSKYSSGRYLTVRWEDGNQQYDARIFQNGFYIDQEIYPAESYVEVTCAMHPNEFLASERLEKVGFNYGLSGLSRNKNRSISSVPVVYKGLSFISDDAKYINKVIEKKSGIKYPKNTSLVVQASLSTIYGHNEWSKLIQLVQNGLPKSLFEEIFIFSESYGFVHSFYPNLQS